MDARRAALAAKVAAATGADEATGAEAAVPDDGRRDILVAGAGDVRHILKTMAEQRKRPVKKTLLQRTTVNLLENTDGVHRPP